ncbi:MAG: hypothetical protein K0B14_00300 [Anaerolineaceae bacterium]|nr:hypothetical protein [Anaerolineaceae bacterium]
MSSKADVDEWSDKLGAQWYFDWATKASRKSKQLEYWQTIRVNQNGYSPSREKIETIARKYSGYTWIIGNEPDNALQDNTSPEKYAQIYHELYVLIKSKDRHAKIAIAGVSQPTPTRLAYLSKVLEGYEQLYHEKLPVDWWNIHAYVLREENDSWGAGLPVGLSIEHGELYEIEQHGDISIFQQNLIQFRKWMKENGYQDTPLVVTEYGILLPEEFGFSQEFISDYLKDTSEWMLTYQDEEIGFAEDNYHLVQKFAWFSLSDPNFSSANLVDLNNKTLTLVGESFNSLTQKNISEK